MKLKRYLIRFFYKDELRGEQVVWAHTELSALAVSFNDLPINTMPLGEEGIWITEKGFKISIEIK